MSCRSWSGASRKLPVQSRFCICKGLSLSLLCVSPVSSQQAAALPVVISPLHNHQYSGWSHLASLANSFPTTKTVVPTRPEAPPSLFLTLCFLPSHTSSYPPPFPRVNSPARRTSSAPCARWTRPHHPPEPRSRRGGCRRRRSTPPTV
jgi:hypothetical protein